MTITSSTGQVGTPVRIEWQEHPNTGVTQYQIWRKVKHNGVWTGPTLLTTLNRGTTSYTDPDYLFTEGYTHDMLQYDIRAYYSIEGTYADPYYTTTYGQFYKVLSQLDANLPRPTEYAIANFPNPFNPVTTISFQLLEAAKVTITIYNVSGQRVLQLAEQNLQEGYYHLAWESKAANGQALTSGYYFARMVVNPTGGGETRALTARMLFMK